mgnify:CR=1 FL=1
MLHRAAAAASSSTGHSNSIIIIIIFRLRPAVRAKSINLSELCVCLCQISIECHLPYFAAKLNNALSLILLIVAVGIDCLQRSLHWSVLSKVQPSAFWANVYCLKIVQLDRTGFFFFSIAAPCFSLSFQVVEVAAIVTASCTFKSHLMMLACVCTLNGWVKQTFQLIFLFAVLRC